MNIEIKKGVKDYLDKRNVREIHVEMANRGGCCSGPVYIPVVKLGKPTYDNSYEPFEQDEVLLYLPKKVINGDTKKVSIKVRNIFGNKSLSVGGILGYKEGGYKKKKF